jgi:hypothetical protein
MRSLRVVLRVTLIPLTAFLALSALAGGIGLLTGWNAPPVEYLGRSVFKDFTVPGVALFVLVGGAALLACVLLVRRSRWAGPVAAGAGLSIMFFEFVEILVIGSPPGIARSLQILYFGLGTAIAALAVVTWCLDVDEHTTRPGPYFAAPDHLH